MFDGQCTASACSLKALRLNALPDVQIEEMNLFQDIRGVAAVGKVLVAVLPEQRLESTYVKSGKSGRASRKSASSIGFPIFTHLRLSASVAHFRFRVARYCYGDWRIVTGRDDGELPVETIEHITNLALRDLGLLS